MQLVIYIYIYIYIHNFAQIHATGYLPGCLLEGITSVYSTTRFAVWPLQGTKVTLNYGIISCPY